MDAQAAISVFLCFQESGTLRSRPTPRLCSHLREPSFLRGSIPRALGVRQDVLFIRYVTRPRVGLSVSFLRTSASIRHTMRNLTRNVLLNPMSTPNANMINIRLSTIRPIPQASTRSMLATRIRNVLKGGKCMLTIMTSFLGLPVRFLINSMVLGNNVNVAVAYVRHRIHDGNDHRNGLYPLTTTFTNVYHFTSRST